jgi:hypothetical protein
MDDAAAVQTRAVTGVSSESSQETAAKAKGRSADFKFSGAGSTTD